MQNVEGDGEKDCESGAVRPRARARIGGRGGEACIPEITALLGFWVTPADF